MEKAGMSEREAVVNQAARAMADASTEDIERVTRLLTLDQGAKVASARDARVMAAGTSIPRDPYRAGLTLQNVDDAFRYHSWEPFQEDAGNQVRDALVAAAKVILRVVPDGPDRSVALRKLREARMDANSAITHGGRF